MTERRHSRDVPALGEHACPNPVGHRQCLPRFYTVSAAARGWRLARARANLAPVIRSRPGAGRPPVLHGWHHDSGIARAITAVNTKL